MRQTPVLIVGGGPSGLSTAITLAHNGARSLVVERKATTTDHPKARAVNLRTMELLRQWGIEDAVNDEALPLEFWRFIWCRTLAGEEIARIETPDGFLSDKSPTARRIVPQDIIERALARHARELPLVTLEFSTELTGFEETDAGVVAELLHLESGKRSSCRAHYMVAADGASSSVRQALGIAMEGPSELSHQMNIHFRADLTPWTADRPADIIYCTEGDWIGVVDGTTRWLCIAKYDPKAGKGPSDFTTGDFIERIRRSVGVADLPVEVINASFWKIASQVAKRFRSRRIFLAGDAAHLMSPTGGFGMNTGIQDAHNLGWKLAAVVRERASPALLDSYEIERKPVAESNAAWSAKNVERVWDISASVSAGDGEQVRAGAREQLDHICSEGRALGFTYTSRAIVGDGTPPPVFSTQTYRPTARPGSRAPHVWLIANERRVSTLDLFGRSFVLLTSASGDLWQDGVEALEPPIRTYLEFVTIGAEGDLQDPGQTWLEQYGIRCGGAVLVRPDGHVAWRSQGTVADPAAVLDGVLRRVLALDTESWQPAHEGPVSPSFQTRRPL